MSTQSLSGGAIGVVWMMLVVGATPSLAQEPAPAERGREIALEADRRARGFGDYQARMEMILVDRGGEETRRDLELLSLEVSPDEERSLIYFDSPRDIRGTALLTYSFRDGDEEHWLYLPALRRTKRIAANGRSSPFMGSEFAYEDLVPMYPSQYEYSYVSEEELEGTPCFVIERYPGYEGSGYQRQRLWIDTEEFRVLRIDSWDLRDRLLKTLTLSGYEQYVDRIWRPAEAHMVNHRTDEATRLRWYDYRFQTGLTESDFSRAALGRVR
jgi:outer membrane lipoprotein-sorting protein